MKNTVNFAGYCRSQVIVKRIFVLFLLLSLMVVRAAEQVTIEMSAEKSAEVTYANAKDGELGGTEISGGSISVQAGGERSQSATIGNENANMMASVNAEGTGQITMGPNGVMAEANLELKAVVEGIAKGGIGDENLGLSSEVKAKLEASLSASGKIGAYIDEKGLTIGAEGKIGATIRAEASAAVTLTVLGIDTTVKVTGSVSAGAEAEGSALLTIGTDGKIKFKLGGKAAVGVGAGVTVEFEVSADKLIEKLGLKDISELISWCMDAAENPEETFKKMLEDVDILALLKDVMKGLGDPARLIAHGNWLGKYNSGGNRETPLGTLGDVSVGAVDLPDRASKIHDILHYLGASDPAGLAKEWLKDQLKNPMTALDNLRDPDSAFWTGGFLLAPNSVLDQGSQLNRWKELSATRVNELLAALKNEGFPVDKLGITAPKENIPDVLPGITEPVGGGTTSPGSKGAQKPVTLNPVKIYK